MEGAQKYVPVSGRVSPTSSTGKLELSTEKLASSEPTMLIERNNHGSTLLNRQNCSLG
jgi:hypothetical protein